MDDPASGAAVGVTLFPADYEIVEMITDQGQEIVQREFTDAQLFMHSIQELERVRAERKQKKQKVSHQASPVGPEATPADEDGDAAMTTAGADIAATAEGDEKSDVDEEKVEAVLEEDEEDVIDPRIHYRPMVAELQAAVVELHQMINSIDLIRRREYLEDMRCLRENTAAKKDELECLVETKAVQIKEASSILLSGVDALSSTVEKESVFFQGITHLLQKWKICAPIHGNIPKPFRAGEPLAVDCSFVSAGSTFTPSTRSIADLSFAELSRTDLGIVRVKTPDEYLLRTIQLELYAVETGRSGHFMLPTPTVISTTRAELELLTTSPEDLKTMDVRNTSVLKAVQFSVFCEELFQVVMQEALRNTSNWTDTAYNISNYTVKRQRPDSAAGSISVLQVLDDEVKLRVNEKYHLTVKLMDVNSLKLNEEAASKDKAETTPEKSSDHQNGNLPNGVHTNESSENGRTDDAEESAKEDSFLTETCRFALLLFQQEIRHRHGRKDIARELLYSGTESSAGYTMNNGVPMSEADKQDANTGALSVVLSVIAHNLLKEEVTGYLDELSATLAFQSMQVSSSPRVLEDGLLQPICDSVRGIYVSPRWKTCAQDSTLSAFDLSIGKSFTTEILVMGSRIRFEDGPASVREVSGLAGLKEFVEKTVCTQVALGLYRDIQSFGLKQVTMDLDQASVRLFAAGEWDGSCVGEGRVADSKAIGSIFFEPHFAADGSITISCMIQAVDVSKFIDLTSTIQSATGVVHNVDWRRIPGVSDTGKVIWLLQQTSILPSLFSAVTAMSTALTQ